MTTTTPRIPTPKATPAAIPAATPTATSASTALPASSPPSPRRSRIGTAPVRSRHRDTMRQTEFEFPPALAAPRRASPARAATGVLSDRSRRRPATPQSARLEICPEAFADAGKLPGGRDLARSGAFEAVVALLATIVFGLGWAAFELTQDSGAASGARGDLALSGYDREAGGVWELAAAWTEPYTAGRVSGAPPDGREVRTSESRGNDPWVEGAPIEPLGGRSNR